MIWCCRWMAKAAGQYTQASVVKRVRRTARLFSSLPAAASGHPVGYCAHPPTHPPITWSVIVIVVPKRHSEWVPLSHYGLILHVVALYLPCYCRWRQSTQWRCSSGACRHAACLPPGCGRRQQLQGSHHRRGTTRRHGGRDSHSEPVPRNDGAAANTVPALAGGCASAKAKGNLYLGTELWSHRCCCEQRGPPLCWSCRLCLCP